MSKAAEQGFLETAKKAAEEAGELALERFGRHHQTRMKPGRELVTEADTLAEERIISVIRERFPDHGFLAEESGRGGAKGGAGKGKGPEYTWMIDPVDGTVNFAYGVPLWGVSIALVRGREPVLGVISIPLYRELFWAQKGSGACMNGKPLHVSERGKMDEMLLLHDSDFIGYKERILSSLDKTVGRFYKLRMLGAAVMHFTQIARGNFDAWIEHRTKPWDIAAGCLLVEEAGGKVTDFSGKGWNPWSPNLLVSNGKAHGELLKLLVD